jgi:hypothetical protein
MTFPARKSAKKLQKSLKQTSKETSLVEDITLGISGNSIWHQAYDNLCLRGVLT